MSEDEQEALSRIYAGWWCVLLSSGRIAVFAHPMRPESIQIVDSWEQVLTLPKRTEVFNVHGTYITRTSSALDISLKLDL